MVLEISMLEKTPAAVGHALKGIRAGEDHLICAREELKALPVFEVTIPGLEDGGRLPAAATEDGAGISPGLAWRGAPPGALALAVVIEDAGSPTPAPILHLAAVGPLGADGVAGDIPEGKFSGESSHPFVCGKNSFGRSAYLPPDPPTGHGEHAYVVQLFALTRAPALSEGFSKKELQDALQSFACACATTRVFYGRPG